MVWDDGEKKREGGWPEGKKEPSAQGSKGGGGSERPAARGKERGAKMHFSAKQERKKRKGPQPPVLQVRSRDLGCLLRRKKRDSVIRRGKKKEKMSQVGEKNHQDHQHLENRQKIPLSFAVTGGKKKGLEVGKELPRRAERGPSFRQGEKSRAAGSRFEILTKKKKKKKKNERGVACRKQKADKGKKPCPIKKKKRGGGAL